MIGKLKNFSYKDKYRILIGASCVFAILIYALGVQKTISEYLNFSSLKKESLRVEQDPDKMQRLEQEMKSFNGFVITTSEDSVQNRTVLLTSIADYCADKNILINEFPLTSQRNMNQYSLQQSKFIVKGSFLNTLHLIYFIEVEKKLGQVTSVDFKKPDHASSGNLLQTTFYLQQIISNENR